MNHGLRGEVADADEEYVRRLCRELGVPCRFFRENVELIAKNRKQSPEEAGRAVRREAFMTMCREDGGTRIATAHHRDDNAETVLWNMARGTGLKGLGGIRPVNGQWIRPLLALTREQTERYLTRRDIPWREDATNSGDAYTRNRIRHHILPVFKREVNRGTAQHLDELSRQAQEVWDYLEQGVDQAWENCVQIRQAEGGAGCGSNRTLEIIRADFDREMPAVQKQLLRRCLAYIKGQECDIGAVHVAAVAELFGKQTGRVLDLPGGVCAERTYAGVALRPAELGVAVCAALELQIPGQTEIPGTGLSVICRILDAGAVSGAEQIPQKSYTKWFDYDIIEHSLSARTRQSGDYLVIDEKGNRQKLKYYLINEKIPREDRDRMLLIADGEHIIWIPGYRMSRAYHVSSRTRTILEIKITEEKENGRDDQSTDLRGEC